MALSGVIMGKFLIGPEIGKQMDFTNSLISCIKKNYLLISGDDTNKNMI